LLLGVALKQSRGRPKAREEAAMPGWMKAIDGFEAPKAAGLGVLLSAVNPKSLLLVVAAAAAISQTGIGAGKQAVAGGLRRHRDDRPRRPGRHLLRDGRALEASSRRAAGMDGAQQRGNHGGDLPADRGEADR